MSIYDPNLTENNLNLIHIEITRKMWISPLFVVPSILKNQNIEKQFATLALFDIKFEFISVKSIHFCVNINCCIKFESRTWFELNAFSIYNLHRLNFSAFFSVTFMRCLFWEFFVYTTLPVYWWNKSKLKINTTWATWNRTLKSMPTSFK